MRKLLARLSRLTDRMIDVDSLIPLKGRIRPVPIKVIFDNLRYYPLLAFLIAGIRVLHQDGSWISSIAAIALGVFVLGFGVLVFLQTWMIALIVFLTISGALLPPRQAVAFRRHVRADSRGARAAVLLLIIAPLLFATWGIGVALFSALARAGSL